jgi:hypothetical protein
MISKWIILGNRLDKVEFWTTVRGYQFSFQFWGESDNNVYVYRDYVEIASFGGEPDPAAIIDRLLKWCEKSNPSTQYPIHLTVNNPQP